MRKFSKRTRSLREKIDRTVKLPLDQACAKLKEIATAKFDETVDLAVRLGVNPRHADQMVRGAVVLPHGTGQAIRVAVFAKGDKAAEATAAGADIVGDDDLVEKINGGFMDFDRVIATPDMMGKVGKLGKVLGPRGLMPNPKVGTVTPNVAAAVKEAKAGKIEYRVEKAGIIHVRVGKASFNAEQITDNARTLLNQLMRQKPSTAKGVYMKSITLSSTMSPGVRVDTAEFTAKTE